MMILNPNCSEIVWKLSLKGKMSKRYGTSTDSYPNNATRDMVGAMKSLTNSSNEIDDINLELIDNNGGGGNSEYVEKVFKIATRVAKGKLTLAKAEKLEHKQW